MKGLTSFSRIAALFCALCFLFDVVSFFVSVPFVYGNILSFVYDLILFVFPFLLISQSKVFKRPATYIIIASSLSLIDDLLGIYMRGLSGEDKMVMTIVLGSIYLFYLVFVCLGFFKLGKLLPKPSLARSMAIAYPYAYLLQLFASALTGACNLETSTSVLIFSAIGVAQLLVVTLLFYSFARRNE